MSGDELGPVPPCNPRCASGLADDCLLTEECGPMPPADDDWPTIVLPRPPSMELVTDAEELTGARLKSFVGITASS